jgi:hypothetical protein
MRRYHVPPRQRDAFCVVRSWVDCITNMLGFDFRQAQRLIGSIRRECLDHIVVFGERHLRHVLLSYMDYYNGTRTHLSLNKDAPISRVAEASGRILCRPIMGGLHHQYARA